MTESREPHPARFQLGDWRVDALVRTVERDGTTTRLEPRVMAVLLCLVERAGEPVSRAEIEERVWPGAVIGPDTLNRSISKLRVVLSEPSDGAPVIETIPKLGYRLCTPVSAVPAGAPAGGPARRWLWGGVAAVLAAGAIALRADAPFLESADVAGAIVPLTSEPGYEVAPTVSPDGQFVAFQRYDPSGPAPGSWDVFVVAVEGDRTPRPLAATAATEYAPAWSPVGDTVAYVVQSSADCAIVMQSALGGAVHRLTACDPGVSYQLAWEPDAKTLVVSKPGPEAGIFRLDRASGSLTRVTTPPPGFLHDMQPSVSPGGGTLAFVRTRAEGISDLYLVSLSTGGDPTRLTRDHRRIGGHAWTADGREVLFSSNRGGNSQLWKVPATGGDPVRVPMSGRHTGQLAVSATGTLVYEEYNGDSNIREIHPDSGLSRPWSNDTRSEWSPRISPDGSRVAFLTDRSGAAEVWVSERDGSRPRRITHVTGAVLDPAHWSPDGERLVYAAAAAGNFDVYTVAVTSGVVQRVTQADADDRAPSWSSDTTLVFASNRTGDWELWQYVVGVTAETRMTWNGGFGSIVGDDGQIFFTRTDRPGLFALRGTGQPSLVWDGVESGDWANVTVAAGEIFYFPVTGDRAPVIRVFDLGSGRVRSIQVSAREAPPHAGISVGADGAILFSQVDRSESDLWMATVR